MSIVCPRNIVCSTSSTKATPKRLARAVSSLRQVLSPFYLRFIVRLSIFVVWARERYDIIHDSIFHLAKAIIPYSFRLKPPTLLPPTDWYSSFSSGERDEEVLVWEGHDSSFCLGFIVCLSSLSRVFKTRLTITCLQDILT